MLLDALMKELGIKNPPDSWVTYYPLLKNEKSAMESFPSRSLVESHAKELKISREWIVSLLECHEKISHSEALLSLWNLWVFILFKNSKQFDVYEEQYQEWPLPEQLDDQNKDAFRVLVLLSQFQGMEVLLKQRGLLRYKQDVIANFSACMKEHHEKTGNHGLSNEFLWWIWAFMLGRIFRIGILEYEIVRYIYPYKVYANSKGGHRALCSEEDIYFDERGYPADQGPYCPKLRDSGDSIIGYGFNSLGQFDPQKVVLDKREWREALRHGDYALNIHIPGDKKLNHQDIIQSLQEARVFFKEYFQDYHFSAMLCYTWLLDTQLKHFLPLEANILGFQNQFTLIMSDIDPHCIYDYIFQTKPCSIDKLIPRNAFQRKVLSFVKEGGSLRDGFGYILL